MFVRTILAVLGAILLAQTATGFPSSVRRVQGLRSRSLSDIPAACQADCSPFGPFLAGASCPVTECCSTVFEGGYFGCFLCVGNSTHATDYSIAQEYVDVLTTSCFAEGFTLPELTLPGQNPNRTLATALPPGASTIPIFATISPASASSSAVRQSTPSSASAHTVTQHQSGGSTFSGAHTATQPQSGASTFSGATSTSQVGSFLPGSSGTLSFPVSQSTATSPPSSLSSSSAPKPSGSGTSNAAFHLRTPFRTVVGVSAIIGLQVLLA
ncbi:hypothetical protein B0H11DRAFT_2234696 [Mycena galericulata]|nr:hypothetical protein B0H11DRAFT_2234696 [Mycena galericulata]